MTVSAAKLETWSHQGAVTTSKDTYHTIRNALESQNAPYMNKNFEIFLQGSYGNDTNVYAESDVDVVIKLNDTFYYDTNRVSSEQEKERIKKYISPATYHYDQFKADVLSVLKERFGSEVKEGKKAISIDSNGVRRKTDVVVAFAYRDYYRCISGHSPEYYEGISFFTTEQVKIINYPKQHSNNLTTKHQSTKNSFKPMIRILKNIKNKFVESGTMDDKTAPSYYIEGLIYNVPSNKFSFNFNDTLQNILTWYDNATDKSKLVCANEMFWLLRDGNPTSWQKQNCDKFIKEIKKLLY